MQSVRQGIGSVGQTTLVTNRYTVLENGMHFWDSEASGWVESRPEFVRYPDAIVGTGAGHRVILNPNLNTFGSVDFKASDGSRMVSHPLAILYFDPESGRSVTVGTIKDCTGEILSSNSVIYSDCFEGQVGKVALIYTYDKGSFRQDVSFLERPPDPAAFGLGEKSRMEVITEIVQSPELSVTEHVWSAETNAVKRAAMAEPDVVDETISFGAARMTLGWAFSSDQPRQRGVPVAKRLMEIDGRRVLVESLEWQTVRKSLDKLFPRSANASGKTRQASAGRSLPANHIAQAALRSFETRLAQVTQSDPETRTYVSTGESTPNGFVVDYTVLDSYLEDFTFASGQTYVVDGYVFVDSPTFERGATIKAEQGANLTISGSIQGPSGSVGKVVLTAVDDNSIGATISGSTGNPSGTYAEYALASYYVSSYPYWHDLDIRYAETGFYIYGGDHSISSSLFYKCDVGVYAASSTVSVSSSDFCEVGTWSVGEVDTSSLTECQADRDSDGLPDNWEFEYFGNLSQTASGDYDGDGDSNLDEYNAVTDPNTIMFRVYGTNNYVGTTSTTLHLEITGGVPSSKAVLVDSTNFAGATWTGYSSTNVTVSLGSSDGWHEVWTGLRGRLATSEQTWQWKRLKLDRVPPSIFITTPTNSTVDLPMIQLVGYSPECLDSISYDLTNACGLVSNRDVFISDRFHDSTTWEFTTNTFQAYDVDLTNGVNKFTIHATDMAGNSTTTNFTFTLDYSGKTNPPAIQLFWPQNGEKISGDSFTWRGWVNDPTATVSASIVSTHGATNTVSGLLERNGNFWVENLPMPNGTNSLMLTVTDSAGNIGTTNITVSTSPLTVTMTPISSEHLWELKVTATGTISDSSYSLWINGVKAVVSSGTWTASNVPMTEGGVAIFDITAYEPGETQPDGSHGN